MASSSLLRAADSSSADEVRFERLQATPAFRNGGFAAWSGARLAVIGAGLIGSRLAEEAVLSGASVSIFDPDVGELGNLGTQRCRVAVPKAKTLVERCDALRPGHARAFVCDVRRAGVRPLLDCALWFDCSDDPQLAWPLSDLSNGLARPMLRCAVDGSGESELGRVLCSHGGAGHACQVCSYSLRDLLSRPRRTPCPREASGERPHTNAGGAIGAGTAGLALSLGQRLIAGSDGESVLNHEFILDWTNFQMFQLRLTRSNRCLSGHRSWEWRDVEVDVEVGTLRDLFGMAERESETRPEAVAFYLQPLNRQVYCSCGAARHVVGTDQAAAPRCPDCGIAMLWLEETRIESVRFEQALELGIIDKPLAALGVAAGSLVVASSPGRAPRRMLLP